MTTSHNRKKGIYEKYFKRLMDFALSTLAILVLSPIFLLLFLLIRIKLGAPVIFKQKRPGRNGRIYTLYKFRTMTEQRDSNGALLSDELRLTPFGKWLRSTSLDELPELINICIGEMSIVGPRPLLVQYLQLYNTHQSRRHEVLPGLTGLAQVNGRNAISWEEKFDLDVKYVDNISFLNDCKIILVTFLKVFKRSGVSEQGEATVSMFRGTIK